MATESAQQVWSNWLQTSKVLDWRTNWWFLRVYGLLWFHQVQQSCMELCQLFSHLSSSLYSQVGKVRSCFCQRLVLKVLKFILILFVFKMIFFNVDEWLHFLSIYFLDQNGWRCPGCQNISTRPPNKYFCFCGMLNYFLLKGHSGCQWYQLWDILGWQCTMWMLF